MTDRRPQIPDLVALKHCVGAHELALNQPSFIDEKQLRHQQPARTPLAKCDGIVLIHGSDGELGNKPVNVIFEGHQARRIDGSTYNDNALRGKFFLDCAQDLSVALAVRSSTEQERQDDVLALELLQVYSLFVQRLRSPGPGRPRKLLRETGGGQCHRYRHTQEYFLHHL